MQNKKSSIEIGSCRNRAYTHITHPTAHVAPNSGNARKIFSKELWHTQVTSFGLAAQGRQFQWRSRGGIRIRRRLGANRNPPFPWLVLSVISDSIDETTATFPESIPARDRDMSAVALSDTKRYAIESKGKRCRRTRDLLKPKQNELRATPVRPMIMTGLRPMLSDHLLH